MLPEGVVRICDRAFYNCTALEEVVFLDGIQDISKDILDNTAYAEKMITTDVFSNQSIYVGEYLIKCVGFFGNSVFAIEEGTTFVAENAMALGDYGSIKSIIVPASVKVLKKGSLYTSDALKKVYYSGTIEQWNAIDNQGCFEGFGALGGTSITIICEDGEISYTPEN